MSKLLIASIAVSVVVVGVTAYYYYKSSSAAAQAPPTNVTATNPTTSSVVLSWDAYAGATQYIILQKAENENNYSVAATLSASQVGATSPTYTITNLTNNSQYSFEVQAVTAIGTTPASAPVLALILPVAPINLVASNANTNTVTLNWSASNGALQYIVLQKASTDSMYSVVATFNAVTGQNPQYIATNLTADTSYSFQVKVVTLDGISSASTAVIIGTLPNPPTNLTASNATATTVDLMWDSYAGATQYIVLQKAQGDNAYSVATTVNANSSSTQPLFLTLTQLQSNSSYLFEVEIVTANGTSAPCNAVAALTLPPAPSNLVASAPNAPNNPANVVVLSWNLVDGGTQYIVSQKSEYDSNYVMVANYTNLSGSTYVAFLNNLIGNTSYSFQVQVVTADGTSAPSNVATYLTVPDPIDSNTISGSAASSTAIQIYWPLMQHVTSYNFQYKEDSSSDWGNVGGPIPEDSFQNSLSIQQLNPSTVYDFRLQATNPSGTGDWSNPISIETTA